MKTNIWDSALVNLSISSLYDYAENTYLYGNVTFESIMEHDPCLQLTFIK